MALVAGYDIRLTAKAGVAETTGDVTGWTDQVTGTRQLTVPSGQTSPRFGDHQTPGGFDALTFDGTSATLRVDDGLGNRDASTDATIYYVYMYVPSSASGVFNYLIDGGDAVNRLYVRINADQNNIVAGSTNNFNASYTPDTWFIATFVFRNSGTSRIYIDGTESATTTSDVSTSSTGLTVGARRDLDLEGESRLAEIVGYHAVTEHSQTEVDQNVSYFQDEWGADTTDPTPGNSGAFSAETNINSTSFTANWTQASDDKSSHANMLYYVYHSSSDNMGTVSDAETNGTLVNAGGTTGIETLNVTGLTQESLVYYTVVVEDEAGNKAKYETTSVQLSPIYGNVQDGGVNDTEAVVQIYTLPEDTDPTSQPTFVETASVDGNGDWEMSSSYDSTKHYLVNCGFWETDVSATADSGTASSITDTGAFTSGKYDSGGYAIRTTGGTGSGQTREITSNTADTVNFTPDMSPVPDGTTTYEVVQWQSDGNQIIIRME